MSSKKSRLFASLILVLLLVLPMIPSVLALKEDFRAYTSYSDITAYPCSSDTSDSLTVQNTGDIESSYFIHTSGDGSRFVTHIPNQFSLKPGESKQIQVFVSSSCSVEGTFDLKTTIQTSFDLEKNIMQKLVIKKQSLSRIVPAEYSKTTTSCKPAVYELEIRNLASYTDSLTLSLEEYGKYARFSENPVILPAKDSRKIYLFLDMPCSVYGEKTFTVSARSSATSLSSSQELKLDIIPNYDFTIEQENPEIIVCEQVLNQIPLKLINLVEASNEYTLDIKSEPWITLPKKSMSLWGNQEAFFSLQVIPPEGSSSTKTVEITAVTKIGEIKKIKSINLNIKKCFGTELNVQDSSTICGGDIASYKASVLNTGIFAENATLYLFGDNYTTLSANLFTLQAGKSAESTITVSPPMQESGLKTLKLLSTVQGFDNIRDQKNLTLNIFSIQDCLKPELSAEKIKLEKEKTIIPVTITNAGARASSYNIKVLSPSWASVMPSSLSLEPSQTSSLSLELEPDAEVKAGKHDITLQITASNGVVYQKTFSAEIKGDFNIIDYLPYILLIIIILSILAAVLYKRSKAENEDIKDEELREEEFIEPKMSELEKDVSSDEDKDKNTFRNILFVLVAAALIIALAAGIYYMKLNPSMLAGNESALDAVNASSLNASSMPASLVASVVLYKYYIITAIIILIILIIAYEYYSRIKDDQDEIETIIVDSEVSKRRSPTKVLVEPESSGTWKYIVLVLLILGLIASSVYYFASWSPRLQEAVLEGWQPNLFESYWYHILTPILIILIIIMLFLIFWKQDEEDITEVETDAKKRSRKIATLASDEPEDRTSYILIVLGIALAIIIIAALIFYFVKVYPLSHSVNETSSAALDEGTQPGSSWLGSLMEFLGLYRYYIIAGFICLIILIILYEIYMRRRKDEGSDSYYSPVTGSSGFKAWFYRTFGEDTEEQDSYGLDTKKEKQKKEKNEKGKNNKKKKNNEKQEITKKPAKKGIKRKSN